jgi:hypothetical protein
LSKILINKLNTHDILNVGAGLPRDNSPQYLSKPGLSRDKPARTGKSFENLQLILHCSRHRIREYECPMKPIAQISLDLIDIPEAIESAEMAMRAGIELGFFLSCDPDLAAEAML